MTRTQALVAVLVATSGASLRGAAGSDAATEALLRAQFDEFVALYGKTYGSDSELEERYAVFKDNIDLIALRNAAEAASGGSATHGITKFSDLREDEFLARYLTSALPDDLVSSAHPGVFETGPQEGGLRGRKLSTYSADWTGTYTTAVKNQGYCGSCWAFSVVEQVESDAMRLLNVDYTLSPQELVSCDTSNSGCNGGWTTTAYDYVKSQGGLVQEAAYPYTSFPGTNAACIPSNQENPLVTISNYYQYYSEQTMAQHVGTTGPLSIAIDASQWSSYTGGIMSVCGTSIDHAVQVTGVDTDPSNSKGGAYWKVRNSWGSDWGESGYIFLSYGSDTCGITTIPTYTDVMLTGGTLVPTITPTDTDDWTNKVRDWLSDIEDATGLSETYVVAILVFVVVFVCCSCISCCTRKSRPRQPRRQPAPPVRHIQNPQHGYPGQYAEYPTTTQATLVYTPLAPAPSAPPAPA